MLAGRPLLPGGDYVAPAAGAAETRVAAAPPPRGAARMWFALAALSATMAIASQQPKQLILVALACLCAFVRTVSRATPTPTPTPNRNCNPNPNPDPDPNPNPNPDQGCMDLSDAWRAVNGPVLLSWP